MQRSWVSLLASRSQAHQVPGHTRHLTFPASLAGFRNPSPLLGIKIELWSTSGRNQKDYE